MNDRQRDLFLWQWSRRRMPGRAAVAMRGAKVGALGGVLFTIIIICGFGVDRGTYTGISMILPVIERAGVLLAVSVPAFAAMGFMFTNRVFFSQESMYQGLLAAGHQVPDEKPILQTADRWPAMLVGLTVVVIVGFIIFIWVKLG